MGANGPSEDGHGEQVDSNAPEQVEHRELLSILEQLDQDVGTTHNDITELAGGAMQADTVPSFEQSWQESAGNATPAIGPEGSEPEREADSDQNLASDEVPATISMAEYAPEPAEQSVTEQLAEEVPGQESWRDLPDIDADGAVEWIDFREAA